MKVQPFDLLANCHLLDYRPIRDDVEHEYSSTSSLVQPCVIPLLFFLASYFTNSISMTLYYSLRIEENVERGAISFLPGQASSFYDLSSLPSQVKIIKLQNHWGSGPGPTFTSRLRKPWPVMQLGGFQTPDAFFGSMRLKEAGKCHLRTN